MRKQRGTRKRFVSSGATASVDRRLFCGEETLEFVRIGLGMGQLPGPPIPQRGLAVTDRLVPPRSRLLRPPIVICCGIGGQKTVKEAAGLVVTPSAFAMVSIDIRRPVFIVSNIGLSHA